MPVLTVLHSSVPIYPLHKTLLTPDECTGFKGALFLINDSATPLLSSSFPSSPSALLKKKRRPSWFLLACLLLASTTKEGYDEGKVLGGRELFEMREYLFVALLLFVQIVSFSFTRCAYVYIVSACALASV